MNSTNSAKPSDFAGLLANLRERITHSLLKDLADQMFWVHHPDSGYVIEAVLRVLPDSKMDTLSALCVGNEDDDLVQMLASSIVLRVAHKQDIEITSSEMFVQAAKNFLLLVNIENLRRKGHMEYQWPKNLFSDMSDYHAFTKLTASGESEAQKELLSYFKGKYIN